MSRLRLTGHMLGAATLSQTRQAIDWFPRYSSRSRVRGETSNLWKMSVVASTFI